MVDIVRKGRAVWGGGLRDGSGQITSESRALNAAPYEFSTRFEEKPGTNPEELIAAAHAGCFSMALSATLTGKGKPPRRIETEATCHLTKTKDGFSITKMDLDVVVDAPGLALDELARILEEADAGCPVSNLLRTGLTIERRGRLAG